MGFLIMYILACFWHLPPRFVGHDARIASSSDSRNISKISSSDMHIYSSQVLTKQLTVCPIYQSKAAD